MELSSLGFQLPAVLLGFALVVSAAEPQKRTATHPAPGPAPAAQTSASDANAAPGPARRAAE